MHAPLFWKEKTRLSTVLKPLAGLYGLAIRGRQEAATPLKLSVPVICVGNVVAGGSGKTPIALALGALLKAQGKNPYYLTRGYKGSLSGPVRVDPAIHTAADVGDEPLLLAQALPTVVSKNRAGGGQAAAQAGADMIIMDDGFQNPSLAKNVSLLVIDGAYGFGNGLLLPAGPLREPVAEALKRASAVILMGEDRHNILAAMPAHLPVLRARIEPLAEARALEGVPVLAFAGIARPRKFYRTLQQLGADVRRMEAYPDHHAFTPRELARLEQKAHGLEAKLVTTAKDYVRLPVSMRGRVTYVPVEAVFDDESALLRLVMENQT